MDKQTIIDRLHNEGITLTDEKRVNDCGFKLAFSNKSIVNIYDKGTYNVQGKNTDIVKNIIENNVMTNDNRNKKVFVVYGHDLIARTQLEAMLRRWDLEPLILDQLPSEGATVIEKLENYTSQVEFGIVLATPDDMGYSKQDGEEKLKCRVRQNVVLELGMLLSAIGRSKVAVLLKTEDNFERPSDIEGLIYIPFKNNVEESKVSLAKEMTKNGYLIDVSSL